MALTKNDLVKALAKENGFEKKQSLELIESLIEIIKFTLSSGEDVLVRGFGKFCVYKKRQRRGRNPVTGEDMKFKARRVVKFKCSRNLRDKIDESQ